MSKDDKLSKVFDVEPLKQGEVISTGNEIVPQSDDISKNIDHDYDVGRNNLHKLLNQGQDALFHALEIAKQSEHPRAFEVVGNLINQLADINEKLLKMNEQKMKLDNPGQKTGEAPKAVTNNAIFVGSTSELSNLIKNMNKND